MNQILEAAKILVSSDIIVPTIKVLTSRPTQKTIKRFLRKPIIEHGSFRFWQTLPIKRISRKENEIQYWCELYCGEDTTLLELEAHYDNLVVTRPLSMSCPKDSTIQVSYTLSAEFLP